MINKNDLIKFIEEVQNECKDGGSVYGCRYKQLTEGSEEDLYLVFTSGVLDQNGLLGKVAYNSDDLKCDFDWDWDMPRVNEDSVMDTLETNCDKIEAEELATIILSEVEFLVENVEKYKEV